MLFQNKIKTSIYACLNMENILSKALDPLEEDYIPRKKLMELMKNVTTDFGGKGYSSTNYQFRYIYEHEFLIEPLVGDGIHLPDAKEALGHALLGNKDILQKFIKENADSDLILNIPGHIDPFVEMLNSDPLEDFPEFKHLLNIYNEGRFEVKDRKICAHGEGLQIGVGWSPKHSTIHY
jgi:hypothetical protein